MKRICTRLLVGLLFVLGTVGVNAQIAVTVTGNTNTTPNLLASYTSLALALTDLNLVTAMTGPVTLTCTAGGSETAPPTGLTIGSATLNPVLSAVNTVTINKSGGTVTLNAGVGTATPTSAVQDGILKIVGADYITIDGLTFTDANAANPATMEFGIGLFKLSLSDGAQNNTIQNCIITLNRINNAASTAPAVEGSRGINVVNSTDAAQTTSLTPTTAAGTNSNNKFYANTIQNCNYGIALNGFAATTPFTAGDTGNDIGGVALATGNTILNYGGGAATSPAAGIRANNQWGINISYNTVNNNNGAGVNHATTLRGIYAQAGTSASATINNNTVTVQSGATTSALNAIENAIGSTAAANTININNNTIRLAYTTATTGVMSAITNSASAATVNINNNNIQGVAATNYPSTGTINLIVGGSPAGPLNITGNTLSNFTLTGVSGTFRGINGATPTGLYSITGNTVENFSYTTVTSTGSLTGIYNLTSAATMNVNNNIVRNFSTPTTGTLNGIQNNTVAGTFQCRNNQIYNFSTAAGGTGGFSANGITWSNANVDLSGNIIYAINSTGTTGGTGGTINGITHSGAATVTGNAIYDISSNSTNVVITGITTAATGTNTVSNNLVGDLRAPNSTGNIAISGMLVSGGTTNNIYHNSVNIASTTASVTTFGTSAIYFSSSTPVNNLRNNIFVNTSAPGPTGGFTAAIRYTIAPTSTNFPATNNNNFYYAGVAAANKVLYCEGSTAAPTNGQQTIAAYKTYINTTLPVAGREAASVSEIPNWVSTTGSNPITTFLQYNTGIATQIEQGGGLGTGISTDYAATTRCPGGGCPGGAATPDMGAWELNGLALDLSGPSISYTAFGSTSCLTDRTLSPVTITDGSGVDINPGTRPRLYYKKSADANTFNDNTNATDGWKYVEATGAGGSPFSFTTNYSLLFTGAPILGETIQYFVVAQDNAATPNVGINTGTFAATPASVALTAAAFPIGGTPGSYIITPAGLSGTVNVGAAETFKSLTEVSAATGIFAVINANGLSGNTTVVLMDASIAETGATALNTIASSGCSGGPFTLIIKPNTTTTLTGTVASGALIKLNGADNVTIDGSSSGGSDRSLTITNSSTTAPTGVSLASLGIGLGATNNTVKNCNISTGVQTTTGYGIAVGGSTPGTSGADNDNVTIQNNSISDCVVGIYAQGTAIVSAGGNDNLNITGNTVAYNSNLASNVGINVNNSLASSVNQNNVSITTSATSGTSIAIQLGGTTGATVSQNTVSVATAASNQPVGISLETNFVSSSVTRNLITQAVSTNTGGYGGRGITVGTGTASSNLTIANNVIYGVNGSNWNTFGNSSSIGIAIGIIGSSTTITTTAGGINLYFNSVSMTGSMGTGSTTAITTALYVGTGASALNIRDNIFANTQTGTSTTQKNYAIYSAAANTAFTTINNNDYFVSNSFNAASAIPGFLTSDRVDLAAIQAGFGSNLNSIVANPLFNSSTDLRPGTGSPVVGAGENPNTTGISTDFLNVARGTPPTMGAYENAVDVAAPVITYTTLLGTCSAGDRILAATIIDGTGVPTAGILQPRIYYRKNAGAWFSSQGVLTSGTGTNGTWDFTIIAADMGGVANPDVISYYVIAQDLAAIPNIGSNPAAGLVATDVNTVSTAPTTPNTYLIQSTLAAGTYNVGAGQTYTTLTAAINAYNTSCLGGPIVFELLDATYAEAGAMTIAVNPDASAVNTLTIRPAVGVTAAVSATVASGAVIKILGKFITIDGSNNGTTSRDLTITNGSVTTPNVLWIGSTGVTPITDVTIKNSILINGVNTSSAVVVSDGTVLGTAGYFNNISIENNSIQRAYMGVYSIAVVAAGNGSGLLLSSNDLSTAGANAIRYIGLYVQGVDGATVQNNTIGNFDGVSNEDDKGMWLATGTVNSTVSKNRIFNLNYSGTGGYGGHGIYVSSGTAAANVTLSNNMIANLSGDGWTYTGVPTDNPIGIAIVGAQTGINVHYNSINFSGNTLNQTDAMSMGIYLGAGSVANLRDNIIVNNLGLLAATGYGAAGVYVTTSNTQLTASDYNDYYVNPTGSGNKFIGQIAAAGSATIAAWRTATAQDVNSLNVLPNFVSATDLHLVATTNCALDGYGTPVAVLDDYDGDGRDVTTPDMGADEFTATYGGTLAGVAGVGVCENKTVSVNGTTYATGVCDLIARLLPSGADPVAGKVNVCVTLDATQQYFNGEPYVQRHFDLEPTTSNQTTTSATITLYFTDAEFALYNTNNPVRPPLPTVAGGANADPNRANVKVTQFHGTATTSPSSPGNYTGVRVLILPTMANVSWNGSFWEITFDVAGFSGFYVHTNIFNSPLPISINYFNGSKQGSNHLLNWKVTCNSTPRATMTLERSGDSRNFSGITTITADAVRCNQPFDYTDAQPLKGMNYYRLKIVDDNGAVSYSGIVALLNAVKGFDIISIAPNPVVDNNFKLNVTTAQSAKMDITIIDMQGRLVNRQTVAVIAGYNSLPVDVSNLATGTYTIQCSIADERSRVIRFVKQ